jgi:acetylglutamate kinase
LLDALLQSGFVPVIASVGIGIDGLLFNVNADTFAGHLAARLSARRLVIAGATPGVLNDKGETMAELDQAGIERLIAAGTATVGMIAKLRACSHAVSAGTEEVIVVDGRDQGVLESAVRGTGGNGAAKTTRVARAAAGKV